MTKVTAKVVVDHLIISVGDHHISLNTSELYSIDSACNILLEKLARVTKAEMLIAVTEALAKGDDSR